MYSLINYCSTNTNFKFCYRISILISYYVINKDKSFTRLIEKLGSENSQGLLFLGQSSDHDEAMNDVLKTKPDIVFINLQDEEFIEPFQFVKEAQNLLDFLPSFVAFADTKTYAYDAIKNGFVDYFVTPITELEIRKFTLKFKKKMKYDSKRILCLKSYNDFQYLKAEDILYLKADNNTTDFYIKNGEIVSAFKTLKVFENQLPNNFLRIHKSYIINQNYVSRINYGKQRFSLFNVDKKIPFTKTYLQNIDHIKDSMKSLSLVHLN